ncbi:MAG TPA: EscU/YscU/HrcU family type III secretion system export apparatus switch protein [Pseudidiomarina sp.]|nr:EscU/YscU/HrcU family type III secretion system export apparatus switch protein [Pseudidiomarina sp.]
MGDSESRKQRAIALRYQAFDQAPRVIAKGEGELAKKIIETAHAHGVFIHDDPELVDLLCQLDLDDYVPQMLWDIVSELLVWVRNIEKNQTSPAE